MSSPGDDYEFELDRRSILAAAGAGTVALGVGMPGVTTASQPQFEGPTIVRGSVEQVIVEGAEPNVTVELRDIEDTYVDSVETDEFGAAVFRDVEPDFGYKVVQVVEAQRTTLETGLRVVPFEFTPPKELYEDQTLEAGFNYLETRDGTTLACQVALPDAEEHGEGPYPVLIDYSGYEPSTTFWDAFDSHFNELGYAVVGVNKRGTACSGGKFDFMEPLQWLDGYDMVETIARQDWADGVGLAGKSYPGYTQLYVAATRPPSLDVIVPGHPVVDFYRDVAYPGGIRNVTYAQRWAGQRDVETQAGGERGDVDQRIEGGDDICEQNQRLRGQNRSLVDTIEGTPFFDGMFEERSAWPLVEQIDVPTLLVGAWQDESTGGRPIRLLEQLPDEVPSRLIASNGDHGEYYGPAVFEKIARFLSYYLDEDIPENEEDEFEDYGDALAAYEEEPIEILWELDRERSPRFETSYEEWPPVEETWELYCHPDRLLRETAPEDSPEESASYEYVHESPLFQLLARDDEGRIEWEPKPAEETATFVSEPLTDDHVCIGSALADLWIRSSAADTDIQVTLSEVRPDGQEMLVQTGWLRASHRAEDEDRSRPRRPWHTHREADQADLPAEDFANLRVELFPVGHVFREDSRVAMAVSAPTGNRTQWGFGMLEEEATNEVGHTEALPSKLELPLLPDETVPDESQPACGDVREQPCREIDVDAIIRDIDYPVDDDPGDDPADDPTDDSMDDPADGDPADDSDGLAPGFGVPAAVTSIGGLAYLLRERLDDSDD